MNSTNFRGGEHYYIGLVLAEPLLHSANASVAVAAHLLQVRGMYGGSSMRACNGLGQ